MSIFATNVIADDDACNFLTTVSGSVDTINVNQSIQVGTVHLQLISEKNGQVVFEKDGGIVGRVTSQNPSMGISILDHHISFANGEIETNGDVAQITEVTSAEVPPCSFTVTETISNLWGTKYFKRASGVIYADGTVNFCDGTNGNHFELSGTVCLK